MPVRNSAPVGAPIWIDLASSDVERSQAFYSAVFGWTFESDDVDKTIQLVLDNGGKVIRGAQDTPYGRLAAVADCTGAGFNLTSLDG